MDNRWRYFAVVFNPHKRFELLLVLALICSTASGQTANTTPIAADPAKVNVAIFVFPGVQIIDFAAPYEVFAQAGTHVYTVAEGPDPIATTDGLLITPKFTFKNAPAPDLLVLPGGGSYHVGDHGVGDQMANQKAMDWVRESADKTPQVLTVCNGAFLAAKAGLLDHKRATTFYGMIERLHGMFPTTEVAYDKKYIDNGHIVTTAGLSSGIEGSLYMVSKLFGLGQAQAVALHLEYDWHPDGTFARALLPDLNIPSALFQGLPADATYISTAGTVDHWKVVVDVPNLDPSSVMTMVNGFLLNSGTWKRVEDGSHPSPNEVLWKVSGRFGKQWKSTVTTASSAGKSTLLVITLDPQPPI